MKDRIKQLRSMLDEQRGRRVQTQKLLTSAEKDLKELRQKQSNLEQAREIIREVGMRTQEALSFHISDITTLALEAVFDDPYQLEVQFVKRRNKTECDLVFIRNGEAFDPMEASGGGAVDVAAFSLRIASWTMEHPRTRPVIVLDEPLRFLSEDLQHRASDMIKELSKKLGIQFIIITHEQGLTTTADRIFRVTNRKGVSAVKTAQNQN